MSMFLRTGVIGVSIYISERQSSRLGPRNFGRLCQVSETKTWFIIAKPSSQFRCTFEGGNERKWKENVKKSLN